MPELGSHTSKAQKDAGKYNVIDDVAVNIN